jgi:TRAP transporter TAXI family solute receptor
VSLVATRLLRAAGLDRTKDLQSEAVGIDRAPGMLRSGKLDAFFWSGGLPTKAVTDLAKTMDIKLVPLGDLADQLHNLGTETSYYRQAVVPADAYRRVQKGQAVKTVAIANLLITTDRVDAGLVERVTRTVIDSRDQIGRVVHAAQLVDLRTAVFTDPLALHEGARRYYRSVKP